MITAATGLLAACLLAPMAHADRPAKPQMTPKVPQYALNTQVLHFPSGLTILLQEDHSHPIVQFYTVVNAGTRNDTPGREGLAHFTEHTWFRSVHGRLDNEGNKVGDLPPIMDVVNDVSGRFNASTWPDFTDYFITAGKDYLPLLLRLESERMLHGYRGVTEEHVETEKEVIKNEWRRRNEQAFIALLIDYANRYVFPEDHDYQRSSTKESLDAITLADLSGFMDDHYTPENTTITVVGDFTIDEAVSAIFGNMEPEVLHPELTKDDIFVARKPGITDEEFDQDNPDPDHLVFAAWHPGAHGNKPLQLVQHDTVDPRLTEERDPVPPLGNPEIGYEEAAVDYPTAVLAWSLPGGFRKDNWELALVGNQASLNLDRGLRSIYTEREWGDRLGPIQCFTQPMVLHSVMTCTIEIRDNKLKPENVLDKALDQFAVIWNPDYQLQNSVTFSRARQANMAQTLLSLDNVASIDAGGGRAYLIGQYAHYTNDPNVFSAAMNQVMGVDFGRVSELAFEYLKRERAARIIINPARGGGGGGGGSGYVGTSDTDAQNLSSIDDLSGITDDQVVQSYVKPRLDGMVDTTLDNGLRVVILPHGEAPVVQAGVLFGGGRDTQPFGIHNFVSQFTVSEGYDPLEIAGDTSYMFQPSYTSTGKTAAYPMGTRASYTTAWRVDFSAPSGNLDGALWKLRAELDSLRPNLGTKSYWARGQRSSMARRVVNSGYWGSKIRVEHLYPNSDTSRVTTYDDVETWTGWGSAEVNEYLARSIQPGNAALIIVGKIDPDEALAHAKTYFGGWKPKAGVKAEWIWDISEPEMPTASSRIVVMDDPKRTQTNVRFSCRLNYDGVSEDWSVDVLGSLLANQTFQTIRVKEGLAYSPSAFAASSADGSAALQFQSLSINEGVGRTVQFFNEAVERVKAGEVDTDEITQHKLRLARSQRLFSQSTSQMLRTLSIPIMFRDDWEVITKAPEWIAEVKPDKLTKLVQGCAEHSIITLDGPAETITPQLDELGYEWEIFDWETAGEDMLQANDKAEYKKYLKRKAAKEAAQGK